MLTTVMRYAADFEQTYSALFVTTRGVDILSDKDNVKLIPGKNISTYTSYIGAERLIMR